MNDNHRTVGETSDLESLDDTADDTLQPDAPPYLEGEASISGSTPDPQSDDSTLDAAHEVGLRLNETYDHLQPLDTAADVAAAEAARRQPPDSDDEI